MKSPPPVLVGVTNPSAADLFFLFAGKPSRGRGVSQLSQATALHLPHLQIVDEPDSKTRVLRMVALNADSGPRDFPIVNDSRDLPIRIPDEILDYYAFVFCQGGFHHQGITFEQFLTVVDAVRSTGVRAGYHERDDCRPSNL